MALRSPSVASRVFVNWSSRVEDKDPGPSKVITPPLSVGNGGAFASLGLHRFSQRVHAGRDVGHFPLQGSNVVVQTLDLLLGRQVGGREDPAHVSLERLAHV